MKKFSVVLETKVSNDTDLTSASVRAVCTVNAGSHGLPRCGSGARYGASVSTNKRSNGTVLKLSLRLYYLAESIRCIAIMLQPFTPDAAKKLLDQLAVPETERLFLHLTPEFALKPGTALPKPEGVFPRLMAEVS